MAQIVKRKVPQNIVAQILLGEAAGEGPEGLQMVADVMLNRARAKGQTLEQVATAPYQFSAFARPDLEAFYTRQPLALRRLADELVAERRASTYQPQHDAQFYVTRSLWENRHSPKVPAWVRKMRAVQQVGEHVLLAP